MNQPGIKRKGVVFTALSALLFGFTPILAAETYDMGSNPETLTFYRNLFASLILLAVVLLRGTSLKISGRLFRDILVAGVLGGGVTTLMLYSSYQYVGVGTATTLHFLYPVFVALICRFFYREKLGAAKVAALVIASAGVLFFLERSQAGGLTGMVLAAASGLTYACYMVIMDKKNLKNIDPFFFSFYMALVVSAAMLCYNLFSGKIHFLLSPKAYSYTFVVAVCTSFLAVALLQLGVRYLSATTAAILCLFEPIASSLAGWLFLHEAMTGAKIAGSVLIFAAVAVLMAKKPDGEKTYRDKPVILGNTREKQ